MSSKAVYVAFDVETTGLVAGVDRIVELAAVSFQGNDVLDSFAALVDPDVPMPPEVTAVNGITDDMLRGRPAVDAVLPSYLAFLSRGTPVAHNAEFDVSFVVAELERLGMPGPGGPVLDTRLLARRAYPGRVSYSLANLTRDLSITVDGAHRALADSMSCMHLFTTCVAALFPGQEPTPETIVARTGEPIDFTGHAPRGARIAAIVKKAIDGGGALLITYRSAKGELTERRISPRSFTNAGGRIGVVAWCHLRGEERTFQLNSIVEARETR